MKQLHTSSFWLNRLWVMFKAITVEALVTWLPSAINRRYFSRKIFITVQSSSCAIHLHITWQLCVVLLVLALGWCIHSFFYGFNLILDLLTNGIRQIILIIPHIIVFSLIPSPSNQHPPLFREFHSKQKCKSIFSNLMPNISDDNSISAFKFFSRNCSISGWNITFEPINKNQLKK